MAEAEVLLKTAPHPFKAATELRHVPAGHTLADLLEVAQPDPVLRRHAHIEIAGNAIPAEHWPRVRPKPGTVVNIRVLPTGGGGGGGGSKNPLRTVLMLAVVVTAAAVSGGALGPAGLGLLGPGFAAGGLGASVLAGGIAIITDPSPPRRTLP